MLVPMVREKTFLLPQGKIMLSGKRRRLPRWHAILPGGMIAASGYFAARTIIIEYIDDDWVVVIGRQITIEERRGRQEI